MKRDKLDDLMRIWVEENRNELGASEEKLEDQRGDHCLSFAELEQIARNDASAISAEKHAHSNACNYCMNMLTLFRRELSDQEAPVKAEPQTQKSLAIAIFDTLRRILPPPALLPVLAGLLLFIIIYPALNNPLQLSSISSIPQTDVVATRGTAAAGQYSRLRLASASGGYVYIFDLSGKDTRLVYTDALAKKMVYTLPAGGLAKGTRAAVVLTDKPLGDSGPVIQLFARQTHYEEKELTQRLRRIIKPSRCIVRILRIE